MFHMRIASRLSATTAALALCGAAFAGPLGAQQAQDTGHKPGGLNKVAHQVSAAAKTTGRAAKSGVRHVTSGAHHVLKKTGRSAKESLKDATGDTMPKPHGKPGGVNKVARDVSKTFKHAGRSAKSAVHGAASGAHSDLTTAGKNAKESVKDSTRH
jgi:hypothetical protein